MRLLVRTLAALRAALGERLLGMTAQEILYTFEDVRSEIRATRAELKEEIAALRQEVDRLAGRGPGAKADKGDKGKNPAAEA